MIAIRKFFEHMSIKTKLILFTVGVCSIALFLGFVAVLMYDIANYKESMHDMNVTLNRLTAENCVYSLEFQNRGEAMSTLSQLESIDGFEVAALYDREGKLFALYPEGATYPKTLLQGSRFVNEYSLDGHFEAYEPVNFKQESIGTLFVQVSTAGLARAIRGHLGAMVLILIAALVFAGIFVLRFHYVISKPVVDLAQIAKTITDSGDYSLRVGHTNGREMIQLYRSFNAMLKQVQEDRSKLEDFNEKLERLVTERTHQLQESLKNLEASNLQLEEANRHKTRFLSSMSHELRTPLNAILGFSDLLAGQHFGQINERQTKYVKQIETSGKHLLDLINDLLDVAKIDAGAMELNLESFSLGRCAEETLAMVSAQINAKKITTRLIQDPSMAMLFADKRKVRQIFLNLLSNAIKYTPENGKIEIGVTMPGNYFHCYVKDSGIGIDPQDQPKIFSEFFQADRRRDEVLGGTGIGLALTRRLVELHGGGIGVCSKPGAGSEFWFTMPLKEEPPRRALEVQPGNDTHAASRTGLRIMVVEDNEVNRAMIIDMLSIHEHKVFVATNGQEALLLAEKCKPSLIFMDIRMPVMDGLEATRALRQKPEFSKTPIVALTASVEPFTKRQCMDAGCSAHLAKPVQSHELFDMIEIQLQQMEPGYVKE